jgi:RNA polymerase sigma-70 factor (ECF subfamily)
MIEQLMDAAVSDALQFPPDFAVLVRAHQAMVFSVALSFLRDSGAAEEVAQDVFLELHRVLPSLASDQHILRWLRRVTAHRSIDALRRRRPALALVDVKEPEAAPDSGDVLLQESLRRLIAELPPRPRMAMILRYQEDLEPTEIAEILEVPVRTVKSQLQRSIALMREKLARRKARRK